MTNTLAERRAKFMDNSMNIIIGVLIPFMGTTLGASCVFLLKNDLNVFVQRIFIGFASGVMVAASVWSLLIPSMEQCEKMGRLSFLPAGLGFMFGVLFLLALDSMIPHLHMHADCAEGPRMKLKKTTMMVLAVTLHNIPEGMAVGVVFGGVLSDNKAVTLGGALALSIGIAIQNFPEGAIISMPLYIEEKNKMKAFVAGVLSGIVEPIAAIITMIAMAFIVPLLPVVLSFAAGAMMYVVVEELIPEMSFGKHSNIGVIMFSVGFVIMMALDVALG